MKQMVSIFLSVLMLLSSSGLSYAQHFCGDNEMLTEFTLGEKQLSCDMLLEDDACADELAEGHDCCDNEYTKVSTDDEFTKASYSITFQDVFVTVIIRACVFDKQNNELFTKSYYNNYYPPPLVKDLPLLHETFLI